MDAESRRDGGPYRFGALLRRYRIAAHLTQDELAEQARVSPRGVRALELGERLHPHADTVRQLATVLGLQGAARSRFEAAAGQVQNRAFPGSGPPKPRSVGGFLGARSPYAMVAREADLGLAYRLLDTVMDGAGRTLMVAGEPGIGKTRFAQEIDRELERAGFLVGVGRCYEPQQTIPYSPFHQVLGMLVDQAPHQVQREIPQRFPYVAHLLAQTAAPLTALTDDPRMQQQRLFRSVSGLITALAEEPVAVLIDDLQWADGASLELLLHLARETRGHRVLLLGTYRDTERSERLEALRQELAREGLAGWLALGPLDLAGTAALVRTTLDEDVGDDVVTALQRQTEGNPFFSQEVLRNLVDQGAIYQENGRWVWHATDELAVPDTVRLAIRQRVGRLGADTQEVLKEASVLGQQFRFDILHRMGDLSEEAMEVALEKARQAGVVQELDPEAFSFDHVLTQQALYDDLLLRRRRRLHRAAGEAMEPQVQPGSAAEVAWHFLQAHEPARALQWSVRAGDEAEAVFAHAQAERQYRTALDLVKELAAEGTPAPAELERRLLEKLGRALTRIGRYAEALAELEAARQLDHGAGDMEGLVRTVAAIGLVHRILGAGEDGRRAIQALLEEMGPMGDVPVSAGAAAELWVSLAHVCHACASYGESLEAAERGSDLARRAGNSWLLAESEMRRAAALRQLGRAAEALEGLEQTIPVAEAAGNLYALVMALSNASMAYEDLGQMDRSLAYRARSLEMADKLGDPNLYAQTLSSVGSSHLWTGRYEEAEAIARRVLDLNRSLGATWNVPYVLGLLGGAEMSLGELDEAWQHFSEARDLAEESGDTQALTLQENSLADMELAHGNAMAARNRLLALRARFGAYPWGTLWIAQILADAHVELGEYDQASTVLDEAIPRAEDTNRMALVDLLRVKGKLLGVQGRWEEATRCLDRGLALAHDMPYPYGETRCLEEHGLVEARKGNMDQAGRLLRQALAIAERTSHRLNVRRIERALATLAEVR